MDKQKDIVHHTVSESHHSWFFFSLLGSAVSHKEGWVTAGVCTNCTYPVNTSSVSVHANHPLHLSSKARGRWSILEVERPLYLGALEVSMSKMSTKLSLRVLRQLWFVIGLAWASMAMHPAKVALIYLFLCMYLFFIPRFSQLGRLQST